MLFIKFPKRQGLAKQVLSIVQTERRGAGDRVNSIRTISDAVHSIWEVGVDAEEHSGRSKSHALRNDPGAEAVIDHPVPQQFLAEMLLHMPREDERVPYVEGLLNKFAFYCLITFEEKQQLAESGLATTMPKDWNGIDRFARYSSNQILLGEDHFFQCDELQQFLAAPSAPFYVYRLRNPKGAVFYIGKGEKLRVLSHEKELFKRSYRTHTNWKKLNKLAQIGNTGKQVVYEIESWHFQEEQALMRESELILLAERENPWLITNSNGARWSGKANRHLVELREQKGLTT